MQTKKVFLAMIVATLITAPSFAVLKQWDNGNGNGNWGTAANWLPNGVPVAGDDVLLDNVGLAGSYTVNVNVNTVALNSLVVGYSGNTNAITLDIIVGGGTVNVNAGTFADDILIEQGGRILNSRAAASITNAGTGRIASGGFYRHNTGAAFNGQWPQATSTFDSGSTIEFTQAFIAPPAAGRSYGNLTLSATGATTFTSAAGSACTIKNTLTVGANATYNISANPLTLQGNIVSNGVALNLGPLGGAVAFDGTTTISGTTMPVAVAATTLNAARNLVVNTPGLSVTASLAANGNITINTPIVGAGTFTLGAGATLLTQNTSGINSGTGATTGAVQSTGARTFSTAANYIFFPIANSVTGTGLTGANDLTINNAGGAGNNQTTLTSSCAVTGTMNVNATDLFLGAQTLTTADADILRSTGFVRGTLIRNMNAATPSVRTFHVGSAAAYTPVTFDPGAGASGTGTLGVTPQATQQPNTGSAVPVPTPGTILQRYWTLANTGLTISNATLSFTWVAGDINGNTANYSAESWNGSAWTEYAHGGGGTTVVGNTGTVTGVAALSDWTFWETPASNVEKWRTY